MKSELFIHSWEQFKKFEPHLAKIVDNYPEPTRFQLSPNVSSRTFAARLRDTVNGMRLNEWKSPMFNLEDLERIFNLLKKGGSFIITIQPGGMVYVGPKIKDNGTVLVDSLPQLRPKEGQFDARDKELFNAILVLKLRGVIEQPIEFVNVSPDQADWARTNEFEVVQAAQTLVII